MLEEEREMEKKQSTRQSSVPPKANGNEFKKDNGTSKNQKFQRRRGNGGGGNFSYNEGPVRKPTPQKYKNTWDKRPRSRGGLSDRPRDNLGEEPLAEYGSAFQSGSRKGNLNHLLNFSYTPHESSSGYAGYRGGGWGHGRQSRTRSSGYSSRRSTISYNKEQFLQANCQFIVKDGEDYSVQLMDPDSLVNWDVVEQVRVIGHESPSCPICLQYPIAAKMTRCGHIYCWACILHYLALGEKSWRKCPICYESVHSSDLKSVVNTEVPTYNSGDTISMTLMKKEKGSIYAVPSIYWTKRGGHCHNVEDDQGLTKHMKLLTATPQQVMEVISEEKKQLLQQLKEAEPSEEAFIESALSCLKERENIVTGANEINEEVKQALEKVETTKPAETKQEEQVTHTTHSKLGKKIKVYKSAFSDEEDEPEIDTTITNIPHLCQSTADVTEEDSPGQPSSPTDQSEINQMTEPSGSPHEPTQTFDMPSEHSEDPENCPIGSPEGAEAPITMLPEIMPVEEAAEHLELPSRSESTMKTRNRSGEESFYFYQASDGQHIYLHSLNARCLVREYGSLENCPPTITATIVEKESVFVTEELRKRLRYLSHLPLTCGFEVAELGLKPPLVSKDTLKHFADDIEKRKRVRHRKNRQEKRWAKKVDEEEKKKMGLTTGTIIYSQFVPPGQTSSSQIRASSSSTQANFDETRSDTSSPSLDTPVGSPLSWPPGGSEGQPARDGGDQTAQVSFAQMLKAGKKTAVWPKAKTDGSPLSPVSTGSRNTGSDESENEDKIPVPEYHQSFGTAIEAALVSMETKTGSPEASVPKSAPGSGKKKKKQLVLFSTSMARGGK